MNASTWIAIIGGIGCAILAVIPGTQAFAAACAAGVAALVALAEVMEADTDGDREAALRRLGYQTAAFSGAMVRGRADALAAEKRIARDSEQQWHARKTDSANARGGSTRSGGRSGR